VNFYKHINAILDQPFPLANAENRNELMPRRLELTEEAKNRWEEFHNEVDRALRLDGVYYPIRRTANKAAEQVLRIVGVFTVTEDFHAVRISLDAIERAILLMQFYLEEALRITDASFSDDGLDLAQGVLRWMKKRALRDSKNKIFSLVEIYQGGPRGVRNKKAAEKVMHILEEHQQVERLSQEDLKWRLRDEC
jgi:ATP-dependent Clp protease ATP-binding subunit ClpA